MKLLILNDGTEYDNWGIQACIDGLKELFKDHEITTIKHSTLHRTYAIDPTIFKRKLFNSESRLRKKFSPLYLKTPKVADELEYYSQLWDQGLGGPGSKQIIKELIQNDVIVFNAEGSTYRKNLGAFRSLFLLYFAKTRLQKKVFFMNGSVTLTDVDATLPAYVQKIFSVLDGVCVREPKSARSIKKFTSFVNVDIVPDSVFALDTVDTQRTLEDAFCFSLSMLPMQRYPIDSENPMVKLINEASNLTGHCKLLAKDVEDQYLKLLSQYTGASFCGANYNYKKIEYEISKTKFLISGRYHHIIFALRVGCPVIPLKSSSHKIDGLMEFFAGLLPKPFDPTNLRNETPQILRHINTFLERDLRDEIKLKSSQLKLQTMDLQKLIEKC